MRMPPAPLQSYNLRSHYSTTLTRHVYLLCPGLSGSMREEGTTTRPYVCCDVVMLRSKTYRPLVVGDSYSSQSITVPHVLRAEGVEVITSRVQ